MRSTIRLVTKFTRFLVSSSLVTRNHMDCQLLMEEHFAKRAHLLRVLWDYLWLMIPMMFPGFFLFFYFFFNYDFLISLTGNQIICLLLLQLFFSDAFFLLLGILQEMWQNQLDLFGHPCGEKHLLCIVQCVENISRKTHRITEDISNIFLQNTKPPRNIIN